MLAADQRSLDIEAQLAAERAERAAQDRRVVQLIPIVARMGLQCGISVDDLLVEPTPSPQPQPQQQLHLGTLVSNMVLIHMSSQFRFRLDYLTVNLLLRAASVRGF